MSRKISFFTRYSQGENEVTNYCGLILKLIYRNSPSNFEEAIASMTGGATNLSLGLTFDQQHREKKSIPDLAITQRGFSIFFETKLTDWFYDDQLERHIESMSKNIDMKILFLISAEFRTDSVEGFEQAQAAAARNNVLVKKITFTDFLAVLEALETDTETKEYIAEFREYLDGKNLLTKWTTLLDVVNCAASIGEIENGAYMCPAEGSSYSHARAKFFGPYANKAVGKIYEIEAVVTVEYDDGSYVATMKWNNCGSKDKPLLDRAVAIIKGMPSRTKEIQEHALQVFLLSPGYPTNFIKTTTGGMFQSKKYFRDIAKQGDTAETLARELNGKSWAEKE